MSKRKLLLKRVNTDPQGSSYTGFRGAYERLLRRFKNGMIILTMIPLYGVGALMVGSSLVPGIALFRYTLSMLEQWPVYVQNLFLGMALAAGYFMFCGMLIFTVPLVNFVFRMNPKVFRGPYYSVDFVQWFIHNALVYLVRYTVLEFITPTPVNILFYRMMGMKIGRGAQINTSNISDPALITLGKNVTIGGSVTLCAHYGQGGFLVLSKVVIGNGVTVGLKASVMGGVEIGDGAKILPHSAVLPNTKIGAGETWGGVPAVKIDNPMKMIRLSRSG